MARVRQKQYNGLNVYHSALQRIEYLFRQYDKVVVSFSGGKDSTAVLNLTLEVARKLGRLPLEVHFYDEEAIPPPTVEYCHRVAQMPELNFKWICLPVQHRNACSNREPYWWCWEKDKEDIWVRPLPEGAILEHPRFKQGQSYQEFFADWFEPEEGKVCVLTGIRTQESLRRYRVVTQKKNDNYITTKGEGIKGQVFKAHPIYDWSSNDVWVGVSKFGWDYNRTYDIYNLTSSLGGKLLQQRICQPFGEEPIRGLSIYPECFPEMWDKMLKRVPGVRAAYLYANTPLYSVRMDSPPDGWTWRKWINVILDNYRGDEYQMVVDHINSLVDLHHRKSILDIQEETPDMLSGGSWKFLAKVAIRGDFKRRIAQGMQMEGMGMDEEEVIRLAMSNGVARSSIIVNSDFSQSWDAGEIKKDDGQ